MCNNTIPVPAPYIKEFEQLGFGMFVHYGLYSQLNAGEWVFYHSPDHNMEEYSKLFNTFRCIGMADIVATAKAAGCKYCCLTTRHHEGFSLYDTRGLSEFDAPHSPTGRDLIAEFVEECRKADIVPFFYHTTLDWWHPDFENNFEAYLDYLYKSVEILCTRYGKIGGLWFDGNWSKPDADWQEDRLYKMIHSYQPEAMIINNTGLHARGELGNIEIDSVTYERGMAEPMDRRGKPKYVAGEMCETLCDHWGIANDINYKPIRKLIEELCECRKVGANFLLNIGPAADGSVPTIQKGIMESIGHWMNIYGKAIYNGRPCITYSDKRDFVLKDIADDKTLYLFRFDLGLKGSENVSLGYEENTDNLFTGFTDEISSITWMDNGEKLAFVQNGDKLSIEFTSFHYGISLCVRVAEIKLK